MTGVLSTSGRIELALRGEYITLDALLKATGEEAGEAAPH